MIPRRINGTYYGVSIVTDAYMKPSGMIKD